MAIIPARPTIYNPSRTGASIRRGIWSEAGRRGTVAASALLSSDARLPRISVNNNGPRVHSFDPPAGYFATRGDTLQRGRRRWMCAGRESARTPRVAARWTGEWWKAAFSDSETLPRVAWRSTARSGVNPFSTFPEFSFVNSLALMDESLCVPIPSARLFGSFICPFHGGNLRINTCIWFCTGNIRKCLRLCTLRCTGKCTIDIRERITC